MSSPTEAMLFRERSKKRLRGCIARAWRESVRSFTRPRNRRWLTRASRGRPHNGPNIDRDANSRNSARSSHEMKSIWCWQGGNTMLRFDIGKKELTSLDQCAMKGENILERPDFQAAIVKSWERVKPFLGLPTAFLIGKEIKPHNSVGDAIDLLAFDPEDSSLTVIELKRGKHKLQLLQAVSYASMVATWGKDELIGNIQRAINPEPEELIDLINGNELNEDVKIILV